MKRFAVEIVLRYTMEAQSDEHALAEASRRFSRWLNRDDEACAPESQDFNADELECEL